MNLRMFVEWAKHQDSLTIVERPIDPYLQLARVMFALDGQSALFEQVIGFPGWRVVSGMCAQRETFAAALQCTVPGLIARMAKALANPQTPTILDKGMCQAVVEPPDLTQIPIPRYHPDDGGPYITSGVAVVKDPDLGRNASFHRLMLLNEQRFTARIVEGRGTHTALQKAERDLPIAIAVGCPIQVLLAASMSPSRGVDELAIADALAPTPLARCQTVDLEVPAEAELILEGHVTHSQAHEGPFPDLTSTMDDQRLQPVIEIHHITHRSNPIFHALLPSGAEHRNLMGMPREPTIYAAVNEVCRCTGVYVTPGGMSWLHAVVQIDKTDDEDGRRAIHAAFEGHSSLKHVVVVDTDVALYDSVDVEWAIATRFQADQDLVVLRDQPSSSLDPSASKIPGRKARTAKVGLDATAPLGAARRRFERVSYDPVDPAHINLIS